MSTDKLTEKLQKKEMEMLVQLARILDSNEIPFILAWGTALGCVRHQGFIPWDDDVDIYILGKDYPRLKEIFATQDTGNLALHDYSTTKGYPFCFPKVVATDTILVEGEMSHLDYQCGIYIDVFLLMETTDNELLRKIREANRYILYGMIHAYYAKFDSGLNKTLNKIAKMFINPDSLQEKLYRGYVRKGTNKQYLLDSSVFWDRSLLKREYFTQTCKMPFEGIDMPMPVDADGYLRKSYGDYLRLPDEDKRVSNHDFETLIFCDEEDKE